MTTAVGTWPAYARLFARSLRQATYPQLLHHYRGHDRRIAVVVSRARLSAHTVISENCDRGLNPRQAGAPPNQGAATALGSAHPSRRGSKD